jgi:hypothetical protein
MEMFMQGPTHQSDELNELKKTVGDFVRRLRNVEGEVELLKEQRKDLIEEFKEKLDMKTLAAAIRSVKIRKKVQHKDTFDVFVDILETYETVD